MDKSVYLGFIGALILGILIGSLATYYVASQQISLYAAQISNLEVFNHTILVTKHMPMTFQRAFNYSDELLRNDLHYNNITGNMSFAGVKVAQLNSFNNTNPQLLYPLCVIGVPTNITKSGVNKIANAFNLSINESKPLNDSVFSMALCVNVNYFERVGYLNKSEIYSQWQRQFPVR